ncbi:MAG: hypothetical protein ACXVZU_05670 [Methanobacteriaceae archaeon]
MVEKGIEEGIDEEEFIELLRRENTLMRDHALAKRINHTVQGIINQLEFLQDDIADSRPIRPVKVAINNIDSIKVLLKEILEDSNEYETMARKESEKIHKKLGFEILDGSIL